MLKPFSGEKNSRSRRNGAQKSRFFGRMRVETLDFGFEKGTSLRGTASFDVFCVKIGARVSAVEPPPQKKYLSHFRGAKSRMRRTETPKPI